jgi:hypothetical protein
MSSGSSDWLANQTKMKLDLHRISNDHRRRRRRPPSRWIPRLATFRRKKPFSDDRATNLGARTDRQVAADKV